MTVGASGTDGHYHLEGVNGAQFTSMRGKGVDFLAPGDSMNIFAPYAFQPPDQAKPGPGVNTFTSYAGTSSSAAFVSGVTALMMSYRNQPQPYWENIVHEDCEALLKRTATDLASGTYFEAAGNDSVSGYGRINADSALSALEAQYKIRHIDATHHSTSVFTSTSIVASGVTKYIPQTAILAPGLYNVDLIEYQYNYSYPFGGETFLDAWPFFSPFFSLFVKDPGLQQHFYGIVRFNNWRAHLRQESVS